MHVRLAQLCILTAKFNINQHGRVGHIHNSSVKYAPCRFLSYSLDASLMPVFHSETHQLPSTSSGVCGRLARQIVVLIELHIINLCSYSPACKKSVVEPRDRFFRLYSNKFSHLPKTHKKYIELHTDKC